MESQVNSFNGGMPGYICSMERISCPRELLIESFLFDLEINARLTQNLSNVIFGSKSQALLPPEFSSLTNVCSTEEATMTASLRTRTILAQLVI